jgi:hypothetical protein
MDVTSFGGIAAVHRVPTKLGLVKEIDERLQLLKVHLPYHESDHVLNLAYNVICGGTRLEDIERLRHDVAYMNALGAELIPDPTRDRKSKRCFRPFGEGWLRGPSGSRLARHASREGKGGADWDRAIAARVGRTRRPAAAALRRRTARTERRNGG